MFMKKFKLDYKVKCKLRAFLMLSLTVLISNTANAHIGDHSHFSNMSAALLHLFMSHGFVIMLFILAFLCFALCSILINEDSSKYDAIIVSLNNKH